MQQVWISKVGDPEVLEVRETADPVPSDGDVLIDVVASGVNFADVMARIGQYPDAPPIPCVVGYEVAGTVRESKDPSVSPGDRVVALTRFGGYSNVVCVPGQQVFRMPDEMSFAEAAAIPVNYFTAYLAIGLMGNLQPDETALIHNAGGGVGIAAIQLGKEMGGRIIGTASAWKHDRLKELGADELIDYRTNHWPDEITRITSGGGVHVVLDPIGGKNLALDINALAPLGRLVAYGFSSPVRNGKRSILRILSGLSKMPRPHFLSLLNQNRAVGGLNLGHLWTEIARLRRVAEFVLGGWERGSVRPVIHAEVPHDQAPEAHRILQDRKNLGKVVLTW